MSNKPKLRRITTEQAQKLVTDLSAPYPVLYGDSYYVVADDLMVYEKTHSGNQSSVNDTEVKQGA